MLFITAARLFKGDMN